MKDIEILDEAERESVETCVQVPQLRLGYLLQMYYSLVEDVMPKQLDAIRIWFPDWIIHVRETKDDRKEEPVYVDVERTVYASSYHGSLYSGNNSRVTHIVGKMIGTTSSNLEKERKTAELIQKGIARRFVSEMDLLPDWQAHIEEIFASLSDHTQSKLHFALYMYVLQCADTYYARDAYDRDRELFPFDDEVFDQILYNAFYQLLKYSDTGLIRAFMWSLLGTLLRNECGRILRVYDSSFVPVHRAASETGSLVDKLLYLLEPERYEPFYAGDDLENRFPGIVWYCDQCEELLNEQEGFDDHLEYWQCRHCGYVNPIDEEQIYDSIEDRDNGIPSNITSRIIQGIKEDSTEKDE